MNLPPELSQLNVSYVQRISNNEYSSSCPNCGGSPHQNGELPDRFRIFLRSRVTGGMLGWCRQCNYVWTPKGERLDPAKQAQWVAERQAYEAEQRSKVESAIDQLRHERKWEKYHQDLNGEVRQFYYKRGIDDFWIDYWMLGYNPAMKFWDRSSQQEYLSDTLTIPIFVPGESDPVTIRHRILHPMNPADKYRPEMGSLPSSLFFTNHDKKPSGRALLVEGEFKAMSTYIALDDENLCVVGTPGKTPSPAILKPLEECEVVYLLLDPDAYVLQGKERITPIRKMIDYFKERARVISLPFKVDDMIQDGSLDQEALRSLIYGARKLRFA